MSLSDSEDEEYVKMCWADEIRHSILYFGHRHIPLKEKRRILSELRQYLDKNVIELLQSDQEKRCNGNNV